MRGRGKKQMKAILAWALALAMIFANVEPVSAAVVVDSVEDAVEASVEMASDSDVSMKLVSGSDASGSDASGNDASGNDVGTSDVTNEDNTVADTTDGDVTCGDTTSGDVSGADVTNQVTADGSNVTAEATNLIASGEWNGLTWQITKDGVLTISGEDTREKAPGYTFVSEIPWLVYKDSIQKAVIKAKKVKSTESWFSGCENLTTVDISGFDTSYVTDMSWMFSGCWSLTKLDLSKCNMNNVTDMDSMFNACCGLVEVKLGRATAGKLRYMTGVFDDCTSLKKVQLNKLNTSNVVSMAYLFASCRALENLDLSSLDTGSVTTMEGMFVACENLRTLNVKGFNTGNVTTMEYMFSFCDSLTYVDVSSFNTSKVTDMDYMFSDCNALTEVDVSNFDTSNVTSMWCMFYGCKSLKELNLSSFDTSNVTDMSSLCGGCENLTEIDFSGFDITKATVSNIIRDCKNLRRVKTFVNLQEQVGLSGDYCVYYDREGNEYQYFPVGQTESIWLYRERPKEDGNLWIAEVEPQVYTGKAIKPEIQVYSGDTLLKEKVDYTVSYKNNTNVNNASNAKTAPTIIVKGKGNYSKQDTETFQILAKHVGEADVVVADIAKVYNKKVQKPVPVLTYNGKKLVNKKDFTVSYPDLSEDNPDAYKVAGTYRILVTGKGNFTGTREVLFTITEGVLMSKVKIASIPSQLYTGGEIRPAVTVTYKGEELTLNTDYTVTYSNNIQVGNKAMVTIEGKGEKFAGTKTANFKITGTSISKAEVTGIVQKTYNGQEHTQEITVTLPGQQKPLTEGRDYVISYSKNINAGTANMTIKGVGGYTGSIKKTFRINQYSLNNNQCWGMKIKNAASSPEGYNGLCIAYVKGDAGKLQMEHLELDNTLMLYEGKDFTIKYVNNIRQITASDETNLPIAQIKGKGNYTGMIQLTYYIVPSDLADNNSTVTMTLKDVVYSEKAGKFMSQPVLTDCNGKKLTAGVDYDKNNIKYYSEDGTELTKDSVVEADQTITVKVTGKGYYTGVMTGTYRVTTADIKNAKFKIAAQEYTGSKIRPDESDFTQAAYGKEPLTYNEDYEIKEVKNNVNKGTATVTIQGIGNYGGTKTVTFKIVAKEMIWFWKIFD